MNDDVEDNVIKGFEPLHLVWELKPHKNVSIFCFYVRVLVLFYLLCEATILTVIYIYKLQQTHH